MKIKSLSHYDYETNHFTKEGDWYYEAIPQEYELEVTDEAGKKYFKALSLVEEFDDLWIDQVDKNIASAKLEDCKINGIKSTFP